MINDRQVSRIIEQVPLSVIVTDMAGVIGYVNNFTRSILGYPQNELVGAKLPRFLSVIDNGPAWERIHDSLLYEAGVNAQVNLLTRSGQAVTCDMIGSRCIHADEEGDYLTFVFRDISREVSHAQQMERKNIEMAKINSELIRSNDGLKRLSDMKSNFLSIASHELKTPLTSIKGYSDIIIDSMKERVEPDIFRMIEKINRAADRLHRVVNDILDVTRIEQKRLKLKPETIDLKRLIEECVEELSQFSTRRGITFKLAIDDAVDGFYGDRTRMQQVFTNLFTNALKFSPDNSAIDVRVFIEGETTVHFVVRDHGIGINPEDQKKIFDPFYEVQGARRHSSDSSRFMGGGTGLGLSIVKGIVERHGGRLFVVSSGMDEKACPGSEFHILIPQRPSISWDEGETRTLMMEDVSAEKAADTPPPHERTVEEKPLVLLVDADREAIEVARMVLEKVFDVEVAESGEAGLVAAFNRKPSLILLDSLLPGLDGYRLCRILKSQDETRGIPVAFFSAGTQNEEIQRCFLCGGDDFIVKPFSGKELVEKIWRLLMKVKEDRAAAL